MTTSPFLEETHFHARQAKIHQITELGTFSLYEKSKSNAGPAAGACVTVLVRSVKESGCSFYARIINPERPTRREVH